MPRWIDYRGIAAMARVSENTRSARFCLSHRCRCDAVRVDGRAPVIHNSMRDPCPTRARRLRYDLPMKILACPVNGPRPLSEFVFGGEVRAMPDASNASDEAWADYVFNRAGEPGLRREWWYHTASGTWFVAERDNLNDRVVRTYLYGTEGAES